MGYEHVEATPGAGDFARPQPRRGWLVATVLLFALGGIGAWGMTSVRHTVPRGGAVMRLRFPDGSRVWVAAGGTLSYERRLTWLAPVRAATRTLTLGGTAFFDVVHDDRPFRVRTADAMVEVLGTKFEVHAASETVGTRVDVQEGQVTLTAGGTYTALLAGQGATVTGAGIVTQPAPWRRATDVATWRTGGLSVLDEPLGSLLVELATRFAVTISADSTVDLDTPVAPFSAATANVDEVLTTVCAAQGLICERVDGGYRLRKRTREPE